MGQISADDFLRTGEQFGLCKFGPVIHNYAAESHMGQDRNQFLSHMAATKNIDLSRSVDLFCKDISNPFGMSGQRQRIGNQNAPIAQIRGIQTHLSVFTYIGKQPQSVALPELLFRFLTEHDGMFIPGRDIVEKYITGSSADHTQILHIVFGQSKVMAQRSLLRQHFGSDLLAAVLHSTTADGAADAPLLTNQHSGTGTPGSGTGGGNDGNQHKRFSMGQFVMNDFQHISHRSVLR